jgi:starch-binding outer membrane protein, SusD/RagB family
MKLDDMCRTARSRNLDNFVKRLTLGVFFGLFLVACESFLEVDMPTSRIVSEAVYKNDATATAAISGIYHQMMNPSDFAAGSYNSITVLAGLSSDELISHFEHADLFTEFYENELTPQQNANLILWSSCYEAIYSTNAVIEGLSASGTLSSKTKVQLEGEARFVRAFCYFYLVNLFDDVPLITSTDYRINRTAPRTPAQQIYDQIVSDLVSAQELLSEEYISVEKVRPNKTSATALLARVYLYRKDWANAEIQTTAIIGDSRYSLESGLNNIFLANSNEAIWQMIQPRYVTRTFEGDLFTMPSGPNSAQPVGLTNSIVNAFEPGDLRATNWVGKYDDGTAVYHFSAKYKNTSQTAGSVNSEYSMVLRLAEQYLIRAEARAMQGNLAGAIVDLDMIRDRAGLPSIQDTNPGISQANLLLAIEQERKVELFTEWGHRWLDLKRTDRANAVLAAKPYWQPTDVLYPIPEQEMLNDPALRPQNHGY